MARKPLRLECIAALAALALVVACGGDPTTDTATVQVVEPSSQEAEPSDTPSTAGLGVVAVPDGPSVLMATVGVPPTERIEAHAEASAEAEVKKRIFGTSWWVEALGEETTAADGSTWRYVAASESRAVNGWVDAAQLSEIEGEVDQSDDLFEAASLVRSALSRERPHRRLGQVTAQVQVSADGVFSDDDAVIEAGELSTQVLSDSETEFNYGPGIDGAEVRATPIDFFAALQDSPALQATERVSINTRSAPSEAWANIADFFAEATTVELYGTRDGRWESVLLVFQIRDRGVNLADGHELFGLAVAGGALAN